jgi:hypothetical protein
MLFVLTIAWIIFAIAFISTLYVEAKQTSWELLESLIAANILGHVIAFPVSKAIADSSHSMDGATEIALVALTATAVSAFMAGGAVWVFRRLKLLGETRRSVRLGYMALGLLLFPSMMFFPFNLLCGWVVWAPLLSLNKDADRVATRNRLKALAAGQTHLPGMPQQRYTVPWSKLIAEKEQQRVCQGLIRSSVNTTAENTRQ